MEMMFYWRTKNMFSGKVDVKLGSSVARALPGVNVAWKHCFLIGHSSRNGKVTTFRERQLVLINALLFNGNIILIWEQKEMLGMQKEWF